MDSSSVKVAISVARQVSYGDLLAVVGAADELGSWQPSSGLMLSWSEGHVWTGEVELPPGQHEFKCITLRQGGECVEWEPGSNRVIEVPHEPHTQLQACCSWCDTASSGTSITVATAASVATAVPATAGVPAALAVATTAGAAGGGGADAALPCKAPSVVGGGDGGPADNAGMSADGAPAMATSLSADAGLAPLTPQVTEPPLNLPMPLIASGVGAVAGAANGKGDADADAAAVCARAAEAAAAAAAVAAVAVEEDIERLSRLAEVDADLAAAQAAFAEADAALAAAQAELAAVDQGLETALQAAAPDAAEGGAGVAGAFADAQAPSGAPGAHAFSSGAEVVEEPEAAQCEREVRQLGLRLKHVDTIPQFDRMVSDAAAAAVQEVGAESTAALSAGGDSEGLVSAGWLGDGARPAEAAAASTGVWGIHGTAAAAALGEADEAEGVELAAAALTEVSEVSKVVTGEIQADDGSDSGGLPGAAASNQLHAQAVVEQLVETMSATRSEVVAAMAAAPAGDLDVGLAGVVESVADPPLALTAGGGAVPEGVAAMAAASAAGVEVPATSVAPVAPQLVVRMVAGAEVLPHPAKVSTGGEDALFVSELDGGAIGVADGVSAWAADGIDPGEYSRTLMAYAHEGVERLLAGAAAAAAGAAPPPRAALGASSRRRRGGEGGRLELRAALRYAQDSTYKPGSATAVLAALDGFGGSLSVVNLGDCGVKVVRNGRIILATDPQQHDFNLPFQLSHPRMFPDTDMAERADCYHLPVLPGDVVVMASDGLFDNMWDDELLDILVSTLGLSVDDNGVPSSSKAPAPRGARAGGAAAAVLAATRSALSSGGAMLAPAAAAAAAAAQLPPPLSQRAADVLRARSAALDAGAAGRAARALAAAARRHAADRDFRSPWAVAAGRSYGLIARLFAKGGKMDDITVVVAVVQPAGA